MPTGQMLTKVNWLGLATLIKKQKMLMFTFIHHQHLPLLKQLRLPFMTVAQLRDPFIENKRVHRPNANQPLSDSEFSDAMAKSYEALEPHIKAMVTFEYYLKQAKQNREQIEKQIQRPKSPKQMGLASLESYEKVVCLRLFKQLYQQGVWQNAGFSHEAVALKLDDGHPFLAQKLFDQRPQLLSPVQYDDSRPPLPSKSDPFPALLRRPEHFAFEQEWRLIRPSSVMDKVVDDMATCRFPKGLIQGIYVGMACPDNVVHSLNALVTQDLNFRGTPLKQIGVSATHLRLVATDVTL